MLFDLQGRRKNVVRVIYAFLALLMGGGLVLLGIGGDASGGLLSAFGIGDGNSSTSSNSALEQQVDKAEETLETDPENERALVDLARAHYLLGNDAIQNKDPEGAIAAYEDADQAWENYLDTKPKRIDDSGATLMLRAYEALASTSQDPELIKEYIDNAYAAAAVVAEARPSLGTQQDLSQWAYLAGDPKVGDEARKKALAQATDSTTKQQVEQLLTAAEKQGKTLPKELEKAIKAQAPTEEELENPLSGFGGSGTSTTPSPLPGG